MLMFIFAWIYTAFSILKGSVFLFFQGLSQLAVHIFPLHDIEGSHSDLRTMSSSFIRQQMLGKLLRAPELRPGMSRKPYLIGLTGGSGSGKSSIGKYLEEKPGVLHVDCDKIAHETYSKGSSLHKRLIKEYGTGILDSSTGEIVRRELGKIVFNDEVSCCLIGAFDPNNTYLINSIFRLQGEG